MTAVMILLPPIGGLVVRALSRKRLKYGELALKLVCALQLLTASYALYRAYDGRELSLVLPELCGMRASFRADGFRTLYCTIAAFMWFCTSLMSPRYFAHHHNTERYYFFNLLTLGGVTGMFLSDDLFTAFIFFEIMSMASYPWVAQEETPQAMRAAATYLGIAVLGGMVTLMGMMLLYSNIGSLRFEAIRCAEGTAANYAAGGLILFGFLAKAGAFPLHIWLPKAHPVAPAPASALLSGLLTKAGVFGVLAVSFGIFRGNYVYGCVLLAIALITMLLGAVLGVFSNNLKRTLACSSMSQIGYILTGVAASVLLGEEGALPVSGAFTHMINHSALKLTLFMTAGAIYMNAHSLDLNRLRGYGRKKPLIHAAYLLGALGLSGVPLLNGYISKTMIHEGLVEWVEESGSFAFRLCEWVFLFAAGLTTAYMLKTYICLFWQKNKDLELQEKYDGEGRGYLDLGTRFALILSAALIPLLGVLPNTFLTRAAKHCLPFVGLSELHSIAFFSFENLKGGAVTLVIGTLVYLFIVRRWMRDKDTNYIERWPKGLDLEDRVYRPVFCSFLPACMVKLFTLLDPLGEAAAKAFARFLSLLSKLIEKLGDAGAKVFRVVLSLISRLIESVTDFLALLIHETVFTDHQKDRRADTLGEAQRVRTKTAALQDAIERLKPELRPDPREVEDLRYGSYLTNTITFGLILATLGIVAALIYIIVRQH